MAGEHTLARAGVRRRTVLKGAAWSVPVIAAAVAAPAWAAATGASCEGYHVSATIRCDNNSGPQPQVLLTAQVLDANNQPVTLPAGTNVVFDFSQTTGFESWVDASPTIAGTEAKQRAKVKQVTKGPVNVSIQIPGCSSLLTTVVSINLTNGCKGQ